MRQRSKIDYKQVKKLSPTKPIADGISWQIIWNCCPSKLIIYHCSSRLDAHLDNLDRKRKISATSKKNSLLETIPKFYSLTGWTAAVFRKVRNSFELVTNENA